MAKKRSFTKYKSYMFVETDPIIDALQTAVSQHGFTYRELHEKSGVASTTISSWFRGNTQRPQFATVAAVARALGKNTISFGSNSGRPHLKD